MHAIVTKAFRGRRDADSHVSDLAPGDKVDGELAEIAVREGNAEEIDEDQAAEYDAMSDEERAALKSQVVEETKPTKSGRKRDRKEAEEA